MKTKSFAMLACLCGLAAVMPNAQADAWDKKTVFTFSGPVEIPGQVLPAGAYVFKLSDSPGSQNVVQVFDKSEKRVIGTFLTIADYRMQPAEKPLVTFEERAAGAPEAIKSWFYPGDNYGNEFVYPKTRATELARQSQQNVPSMQNEVASNIKQTAPLQTSSEVQQMKDTEVRAQKPSGEEVEVAEVFLVAPGTAAVAAPVALQAPGDSPQELPKTASSLPLLECTGLLLLALGIA